MGIDLIVLDGSLDRDKRGVDALTSNVGQLLWSGIVPTKRAAGVRDRLKAADMFSGWGIRTMYGLAARHGDRRRGASPIWLSG